MSKKLVALDLDGVLNNYSGGYREDFIPEPKDGIESFLKKLSQDFRVEIFTVRNGVLVEKWLDKHGLAQDVIGVTDKKNSFTSVFVDDRAIGFDGDLETLYDKIKNFKPYWKK